MKATAVSDTCSAHIEVVNSHTSANEFTHPVPRIGSGPIVEVGSTSFEFVVPSGAPLTVSPAVGSVNPGEVSFWSLSYLLSCYRWTGLSTFVLICTSVLCFSGAWFTWRLVPGWNQIWCGTKACVWWREKLRLRERDWNRPRPRKNPRSNTRDRWVCGEALRDERRVVWRPSSSVETTVISGEKRTVTKVVSEEKRYATTVLIRKKRCVTTLIARHNIKLSVDSSLAPDLCVFVVLLF